MIKLVRILNLTNFFMTEMPRGIDQNNDSIEKQENKTEVDKQLETLIAINEITGKTAKALYEGLKNIDKTDNDAKPTLEMLELYKNRYIESGNKLKILKGKIEINSNEKNELSEEKLKIITNNEFLRLDKEERLQYVTDNNIDYSEIKNGNINEVTFFFDQDGNGIDDSDLYRLTTLGQVCGDEVGEVISNGVIYTRSGLDGEFFNGNQRLIIKTGTKIEFQNLRNTEKINKIKEQNNIDSEKYPENVRDIALESLERNINPELSILILKDSLDGLDNELRQVKIEEFLTQFDRLRPSIAMWNGEQLEGGKYPDELVIRLLKQFDNSNWKEKAGEYGIDEEHINYVDKKITDSINSIDINNLSKGVKGLLDFISIKESGGNYNAIYGNAEQTDIDFTNFTLKEILSYQKERINSGKQSAIGKYQFINKTLSELIKKHNISLDQKFTPEFQDKIALIQLEKRGLNQFLSGKLTRDGFQKQLSMEWASLPKDSSGDSYYKGDGLNKAHYSNSQIDGVLDNLIKIV